MDHVRENLNEASNIQDRLLCVSRLRVIALALGEEKTRSELLPFLTQLRETPVRAFGGRLAPPSARPMPPQPRPAE